MKFIASPPKRVRRGFSLIELIIAVSILAIIMSVALPSFLDSIRKGRRAEGFGALAFVQQQQERFRSANPTYTGNLTGAWPTGLGIPSTTANGRYTLSVEAVDPPGYASAYLVKATAAGSQTSDTRCTTLAVRLIGGQITYGSATSGPFVDWTDANGCWSK